MISNALRDRISCNHDPLWGSEADEASLPQDRLERMMAVYVSPPESFSTQESEKEWAEHLRKAIQQFSTSARAVQEGRHATHGDFVVVPYNLSIRSELAAAAAALASEVESCQWFLRRSPRSVTPNLRPCANIGAGKPPATLDWLSGAADQDAVEEYCRNHGITYAARETVVLATQQLPLKGKVGLSLAGDGESDETWLVMNLLLDVSWAEAYDVYDKFVDEWIVNLPPESRHRIRLTYSAR
jgi:hypothetical protein